MVSLINILDSDKNIFPFVIFFLLNATRHLAGLIYTYDAFGTFLKQRETGFKQ